MNHVNDNQMKIHIPVLGWLFVLWHAGILISSVFIFLFLGGIGLAVQDEIATPIMFVVGATAGILCILFSLPGLAAGIGLLLRKNWGRVLALVVAIFNLVSFPIGTLVSIYAFIVLLQSAADNYFSPQPPAE